MLQVCVAMVVPSASVSISYVPFATSGRKTVNFWRWAVLFWIGVIFFSSTSMAGQLSEQGFRYLSQTLLGEVPVETQSYSIAHFLADKGVHVTMFCVLATLLWKAIPPNPRKSLLILGCGAIVGSCSEFLQRFFPDRDPALRDVLINIGGTALGLLICRSISSLNRKRISRDRIAALR